MRDNNKKNFAFTCSFKWVGPSPRMPQAKNTASAYLPIQEIKSREMRWPSSKRLYRWSLRMRKTRKWPMLAAPQVNPYKNQRNQIWIEILKLILRRSRRSVMHFLLRYNRENRLRLHSPTSWCCCCCCYCVFRSCQSCTLNLFRKHYQVRVFKVVLMAAIPFCRSWQRPKWAVDRFRRS